MPDEEALPRLKNLHNELNAAKLHRLDQVPTEVLMASLLPGNESCLKTRPDGTILDGHHRIFILRSRNVDVDVLPREVIKSEPFE